MTELSSFSTTSNKKNDSSSNLLPNLLRFCSSIFSHPLYISYFLFFSPYLYRLLSFLSPLFITTALLLLVALLTLTPNHALEKGAANSELSESKWDSLLFVLQTFIARLLLPKSDDRGEETGSLDEFEAFLVTFQASIFEHKSVEDCSEGSEASHSFGSMGEAAVTSEEIPVEKVVTVDVEAVQPIAEVKSLESLFQENPQLEAEDTFCQKEDKEVKPLGPGPEPNKVEESERSGSKVMAGDRDKHAKKAGGESDGEYYAAAAAVKVKSHRLEANLGSPESSWGYNGNLGSFGSMRVEREWRRTLACKLFEERHNADADGSEGGMDMLWETHETESNKVTRKSNAKIKGKKAEVEYSEDEEEEDEVEGKLCCLQALKFSAGKMNLGMGRPGLVKFSKALKGIGWLHRHGKKGNR